MGDEFQISSGSNWWDPSRARGPSSSSSSSTAGLSSMGGFGWPTDIMDMKAGGGGGAARSSVDSASVSGSSCAFQDTNQKLQLMDHHHQQTMDPNLQMMGLGLSSQAMDWNQALLRGAKAENSFRSLLQEDHLSSTTNSNKSYHDQETNNISSSSSQDQWRHKLYSSTTNDHHHDSSSMNEFKQINRGFSLDQQPSDHFISQIISSTTHDHSSSSSTCQALNPNFQMDSNHHVYGEGSSTMLQGLLGGPHDHHHHHHHQGQLQSSSFDQNRPMENYPYQSGNYGLMSSTNTEVLSPSWSKVPQFIKNSPSPPKQNPPHGQLQFTNNTPFWNANSMAASNNLQSTFFPPLPSQFTSAPTFQEKPKQSTSEGRNLGTVVKKSGNEPSSKRAKSETTTSNMPAFKVRKEKMGDRITALQQLVSPFGKTDTASVLSEAIEYIKFLHEQVSVLSTPYLKSGVPIQHQICDKTKDNEGSRQDLRSRGLCLVPVASTFPVTQETTVDFWTPTFGGSFR